MSRPLLLLLLAAPALPAAGADADRQLASSLLAISQSRIPEALTAVDRLIRQYPNFRPAQLIKGDLLPARAQPLETLGNPSGTRGADLEQLRDEARQRVRALTETAPHDNIPAYLLSLDSSHRHAPVVDAGKRTVNAAKSWIKVGLDGLSLTLYPQGAGRGSTDAAPRDTPSDKASRTTLYPERPDFALVSFLQDYRSNNLGDRPPKRQFRSRENGRWKIIHETSL